MAGPGIDGCGFTMSAVFMMIALVVYVSLSDAFTGEEARFI